MDGIHIQVVQVTMFVQNCMIVTPNDESTGPRPGFVVDPGGDLDRILEAIEARNARVEGILVTHGHIDHIGALDELAEATRAPVWYHRADLPLYGRPMMGRTTPVRLPHNAISVDEGDVVEVAGMRLDVLHTPGHSAGSVSFFTEVDGQPFVFAGDVLFAGSIGRTDLPGGSFDTLVESIETKLWPLPDATHVLPGHGPPTTIAREKQHNPFVGVHAAGPGVR